MRIAGVGLGQLLLALDATVVSLVDAPRGLDLPVASTALIDSDDVRLGLAAAAGSADVFFLIGVTDDEAVRWVDDQARQRAPVAIQPSDYVGRAGPAPQRNWAPNQCSVGSAITESTASAQNTTAR